MKHEQYDQDLGDAEALIAVGSLLFILGNIIPDKTLIGLIAEKTTYALSLGFYIGATFALTRNSATH